jgi:hypothetical protein
MTIAPIVLFTYKRLDTLQQTITTLKENYYATESDLFIFSDAARNSNDLEMVEQVRKYIKTVTGFRSIKIIQSEKNMGLANSIIGGVSHVMNLYGKAIVIEDDLILSKNFLAFMNECLDHYNTNPDCFSISGFCPAIDEQPLNTMDSFCYGRAHSWGWATWQDRWNTVDWEVKEWEDMKNSTSLQKEFNLYGSDLYGMLKGYMLGKNSSWYIRFTYNQQKQKKVCIYPAVSKVINNGFSLDATHCNTYNRIKVKFDKSDKITFNLTNDTTINPIVKKNMYKYKSISYRIVSKILTKFMHLGFIRQNNSQSL